MRLRHGITFFALTLTAVAAHAACSAQSAVTRPHLVELFSSEGCSSCPPAENWLRTLHTGADVVALEFHVDYWDDLGWRDRFSSARYTARQNEQARRDGGTAIYTPQMVLDGRNWSNWHGGGHLTPPVAASIALSLEATAAGGAPRSGAPLHVRIESNVQATLQSGTYRNYIALVEDELTTQVQAGENRGRQLKHDHVVRAFAGPLALAQAQADLAVPADVDIKHASLVAYAQDPRDGRVGQVVVLPLAQCGK
jgi:hypothetical protein